ncbi:two-component system response regulator YesN [Paenibacillus phyllosphaerae]|uniref:Two-component system response regulator YesN n=1 Tax=Paenibacillus phyllosphaerae TaxID=274593 RepID=A0A7W5B1T6_9BACL|nr:response regulator [Paenibacillus phyllosphaerae]MBB3112880.1 two-component system response regulator YesN [Paenibacillus phyllosphaerae]
MKKVMLVDDEILIRENIRDCVNWEQEGFVYCGDAPDGEIALPLIEQWKPDILITDIRMPFMNGLELCAIVRQRMPEMKIVIMSGHDEFQYAQAAIRLGVEDYCLKPVSASDLVALLHKLSARIDQERLEKKKNAYSAEKLLSDLCGGLITTSEAIEAAASMNLHLTARYYAVVIFDIRSHELASYPDRHAAAQQIDQALSQRLDGMPDGLFFKRSRTETVWILKNASDALLAETVFGAAEQIRTELENLYRCDISVGIGSVQDRLQGIHTSFLEADEDKNLQRLYMQNKSQLWELAGDSSIGNVLLNRSSFMEFVKIGSPSQLGTFLPQFADELKQMNWKASMYGYYLLNDLTLEAFKAAKQAFKAGDNVAETIEELQHAIKRIKNWDDSLNYLKTLLEKLWSWRSEGSDKYGDMIAKVKAYIQANYNNEKLSLQDVAKQVLVSQSHLSKVFSQETGQTLTEYLTQTRIRKAMELLKTTRDKTFEIAFAVGYNDQHYFSNLFKKVTGMTPMEYRRQGTPEEKRPSADRDIQNARRDLWA